MRLIDVEKFTEHLNESLEYAKSHGDDEAFVSFDTMRMMVNNPVLAPVVDAVEVVRCRDCVHCKKDCGFCLFFSGTVRQDGFCSYGKKESRC